MTPDAHRPAEVVGPSDASLPTASDSIDELLRRLRDVAATSRRERVLVGIAGAPGAGKSTLVERLVAADASLASLPMDGFHLGQAQLRRLGRAERKGAPDTFDVDGFVALLHRVRDEASADVFVPAFDRRLEEPIAAGGVVPAAAPIVLVEGNYLLLDGGGWERVRGALDECWFLDPRRDLRRARLVARHERHGRHPDAARAWVETVDEPNARLIDATRARADLIIAPR